MLNQSLPTTTNKSSWYRKMCTLLSGLLFITLLVTFVHAWPTVDDVPVSIAPTNQKTSDITSDGIKGALITWTDFRSTTGNTAQGSDIYIQKVDSSGSPVWTTNGITVCNVTTNQSAPQILSDGAGGAFVVWQDHRNGNYDIYAQRVDSSGNPLWATNGIVICTTGASQTNPRIVSDNAGGAIIGWQASPLLAQRVNSSGSTLWTTNGVSVSSTSGASSYDMIADESGGAIFTWDGLGPFFNNDIYAQRIDSNGNRVWSTSNVTVCPETTSTQYGPTLASDGANGAFIAWGDFRSMGAADMYAQHVDSTGTVLWQTDGIAISTAADYQIYQVVASDGVGGAYIAWEDYRNGGNTDIYAQRVNSTGSTLWALDGLAICTTTTSQNGAVMISDGLGGVIIGWEDATFTNTWTYAQKVNSSGVLQWSPEGNLVSSLAAAVANLQIAPDNANGAVFSWTDYRNDGGSFTNSDIYAQQINSNGLVQNTTFVPKDVWKRIGN